MQSASPTKWLSVYVRVVFLGLVTTLMLNIPALAQEAPESQTAFVSEATVRTGAEMLVANATRASLPIRVIPFLPTMDPSAYAAAKAAAEAALSAAHRPALTQAPAPLAPPTLKDVNCDGVDQANAGGLFPPDADGAVGAIQFVQIVNSQIVVWDKAPVAGCPTQLLNVSLAAFFGYFAQTLFDPRVLYDPVFDRWVVAAEAFPESATVKLQFIAVSLTSDATGGFFIYFFNARALSGGGNAFWDFPQIGLDEDAVIVTGNVFDPGFVGARAWFLPKNRMYAGLGFGFCFFFGGPLNLGTIAPPLVRDQSNTTVLATAPNVANFLRIMKFTATSRVCPIFLASNDIPVAAYGIPPNAPQPATNQVLHTGDNRFQNRSTQVGVFLWQTHATNDFGFATPRFYRINWTTNAIAQTDTFFHSGTSFDFKPSISANDANDAFVTWSASSSTESPRVLGGGKQSADGGIGPGGGLVVFISPTSLTNNFDPNFNAQRWGDYSATSIDPANPSRAWAVGENVTFDPFGANEWGTRFFNMGLP